MATLSSAPKEFYELGGGSQATGPTEVTFRPLLAAYTKVLFLLVLGLILKGALVTSHDAGLAVPDWPTSFGENMFTFHPSKWRGIIFFEHVHRLYASGVGFLTVILAVWLCATPQARWVRWTALAAVVAVIAQGVLGGLTVLYLLPVGVSSAHALLGQSFLLIVLTLAYSQSKSFLSVGAKLSYASSSDSARALLRGLGILMGALYLQLLFGALMRHSEAGLALLDFPTMGGSWIPWADSATVRAANLMRADAGLAPVTSGQVILHLLHRVGAVVVVLIAGWVATRAGRAVKSGALEEASLVSLRAFMLLLGVQVILGVSVLFTLRAPWVTSFHVAVGAALLSLVLWTTLRVLSSARPSELTESTRT